MKRLFTLLFATLCFAGLLQAQTTTQRIVLIEEATNTGCGPCASQNPAFDALLAANDGKVAVIKYHSDWPSSQDPYWLGSWQENNYRIGYYDVSGVPSAFMDGVSINGASYNGAPANLTQGKIDNAYNSPSTLGLSAVQNYMGNDIVQVDVTVEGLTQTGGADNRLHVVLVEDYKWWPTPFPNGEQEFNKTMLKMVTGRFGEIIGSIPQGTVDTYTYQYQVDPSWDLANTRIVVFVQKHSNKTVHQSFMSAANSVGMEDELDPNSPQLGLSHPNPANQVSYVQVNNLKYDMQLQVTDLTGRVLSIQDVRAGSTVAEINTAELAEGIYLYQLMDKGSVLDTKRMVVAH